MIQALGINERLFWKKHHFEALGLSSHVWTSEGKP